ncbi:MAG: chemotaxis protein CheB, partial [Microcoleus sp. SIO2G3]|nr:chemotaxis protein CheB [Microcoleus sp. SIO2G3]
VDDIDYILPLSEIPDALVNLANTLVSAEAEKPVSQEMEIESEWAQVNMTVLYQDERPGEPSPFACPDCGGTLWDLSQGDLLRFRCRTGHAFSAETLLANQSEALEDALWVALRALEEKSSLSRRMAERMRDRNQSLSAKRLEQEAHDAQQQATVIRDVLLKGNGRPKVNMAQVSEDISGTDKV